MASPLRELVADAIDRLPEPLTPPDPGVVVDLVDRLPRADAALLECHLDGSRRMDLGLRALVGQDDTTAPVAGVAGDTLWHEYDVTTAGVSGPAVFVGPGAPGRVRTVPALTARLDVLARLTGESIAGSVRHRVRECVTRLPPGGTVTYVGHFGGRDPKCLRLTVLGLAPWWIDRYLAAIRWPGDARPLLERAHHVMCRSRTPLALMQHLDLTDSVLPGLGLELRPVREAGWDGVVTELIGDVGETLRDWTGRDEHGVRRVGYLKWILAPDGTERVKAYLFVGLRKRRS
ncbi:hypothetical protein [Plantactinospora sp. GCM10030261]|uniref:hypothetical protein n=1 Tax=Plantactinospora sp. GCM10030261 TaxID=3273420 RepID=UPI00360F25D6